MRNSVSADTESLTERPQRRELAQHCGQIERRHLHELFAAGQLRERS